MQKISLATVALTVALGGCAVKTPPNLTPAQQTQYSTVVHADQVSQALSALRNFAIQANAQGHLTTAVTADVVKFDKASQQTLAAAPRGWPVTIATGWSALRTELPPTLLTDPLAMSAVTTLDALLPYLTGGFE